MNPSTRRGGLALAGLLGVGLALTACGGGGGGGTQLPGNPAPLKLIRVDAHRKELWKRNQPIVFEFSAPLSRKSLRPGIIEKAIQIGITTANGRIPAKGSYSFPIENGKENRKKVRFDPTRLSSSSDLSCATNPFGFEPLTTYDIRIPLPNPSTKSDRYLTTTAGKPILEEVETFFITGEDYERELVPPRFTGIDGQGSLGFNPPRFLNGEVPYNARVTVVFDEPMDPASFDFGNVQVKNETLSTLQGRDVFVPGIFVPDVCASSWRFEPAFSFGGTGFDIAVILTNGLKDLAGNQLANPQTIRFRTEVRAGIPTVQTINETFDDTAQRDAANTDADWGITNPGVLQGGAVTTRTVQVALTATQYPGGVRTRVRDHPFYQSGTGGVGHEQWIFLQGELGEAGAITEIGWGPSSNALFASSHNRVEVTLGHVSGDALSLNLANNFDVGTPVKVADSSYTIPQRATIDPPCNTDACAVGYWPFPSMTQFFEYNGKNNLLVDIDATGGTNYQITRIFFGPVGFPNRNAFGAQGSNAGSIAQPVVPDTQFVISRRTTVAQSDFYDSGVDNPDYTSPIISPATQTGGTGMEIVFEGADGILFPLPGNPNNIIPDPTTFTGFVNNIEQLDGLRFVRYRITFTANVSTGQVPIVSTVSIPYIF